jgi:hypothetical protein
MPCQNFDGPIEYSIRDVGAHRHAHKLAALDQRVKCTTMDHTGLKEGLRARDVGTGWLPGRSRDACLSKERVCTPTYSCVNFT